MILFLKIDGVAAFNRLLVQLRPLLVDGQLALGLFEHVHLGRAVHPQKIVEVELRPDPLFHPQPFVEKSFDVLKVGLQTLRVIFGVRSEEHTSELQSLMRISYAVFCLKKKKNKIKKEYNVNQSYTK